MRKMSKMSKWVALGLSMLLMVGTMLSGCGSKESGTGNNDTANNVKTENAEENLPNVDISEKVDLVCYFVGDPPADIEKVQDRINEILLDRINATISFNFTTWTDCQSKYSMVLSGGENCDLIYTSTWVQYAEMLQKGAFMELDDLIDQYAPELRNEIDASLFDDCRVDGKLYIIPRNSKTYSTPELLYREDLREKYDLPVPDSRENLEIFMAGIKENEPNMQVINPECALYYTTWFDNIYALDKDGIIVPYDDINNIIKYWGSEQHISDMKKQKEYADAGYWPSDAIGGYGTDPLAAFEAGQTAIMCLGGNYTKYMTSSQNMAEKNPEWKVGYVCSGDINGVAYPAAPVRNGTAIPVNSNYPERAIMAFSLLYTDEELNHLLEYGIEGDHYTLSEDGYYEEAENNSAYSYEASDSWNFQNENLMLIRKNEQEKFDHFEYLSGIASKMALPYANHADNFFGVITESSAQEAAISALETEYLTPLIFGMSDDIEGTIAKFMDEANKAGLDKVQTEVIGLWTDYLESNGYLEN